MALADDIAALRNADLFSGFSEDQLRLIAFTASRKAFSGGSVLFEEGTVSDGAYLIASGQLSLEAGGRSLGIAGPGSLLAETALISALPYRLTATASQSAEVLLIQRAQFIRLVEEYPAIASEMDRRLRKSFEELVGALNSVKTRLSDF